MKIFYACEYCGAHIDTLEVEEVDDARFGFDCLTGEERQDIIKIDSCTNSMYVKSLCDNCIVTLGVAEEGPFLPVNKTYLH